MNDPLLAVDGLTVSFPLEDGRLTAVRDLSFTASTGETVAVVGESGSGKSVASLAVTRLLDYTSGRIDSGTITLKDPQGGWLDLTRATPETMRLVRGPQVAMIFQEPMSCLNPVLTVGDQITEALRYHQKLDRRQGLDEARRMLDRARVPDAHRQLNRYPFQLSGGMRQRVMIAIAMACRPRLLIADEPTTALDVTVQSQVLRLLRGLQAEFGMGMIFITHDMGVVAEIADRVVVMRAGEKVEEGDTLTVFSAPRDSYTRALLNAVPVLGSLSDDPLPRPFPDVAGQAPSQDTIRPGMPPVLELRGLTTRFDARGGALGRSIGRIHAVENVSLRIHPGETLALVGESGCGKSTTGRSIIRLEKPEAGEVLVEGEDVTIPSRARQSDLRRKVQYIFQDPFSSLDPRLNVGYSISEPIRTHSLAAGVRMQQRVAELLEKVGLRADHARRYPHELSGGQRQRVCIARALASEPKLIIADEAVAALDMSIRAQVVNLLMELQRELGVAYLFISHDMALVERVSHTVAVMYLGQVVEIGPRLSVMSRPQHPYTCRLLAAVPNPDPSRRGRGGEFDDSEVPSPLRRWDDPPITAPLVEVGRDHFIASHRVGGLF